MLSTLFLLTSFAWSANSNLIDTAQIEATSSLEEKIETKTTKKPANQKSRLVPDISGSLNTEQISILRLEDKYQTPRTRTYDFRADLTFESLRLKGEAPNSYLGAYNAQDAGAIPLVALHFGFLAPIKGAFSAGLSAFGAYGLREYNLVSPDGSSLKPRLNVVMYGISAQARYAFKPHLFSEFAYEQGQLGIRQSSNESTLAQWSDDARTQASKLGVGYIFTNGWELAGHVQQRTLLASAFEVDLNQWSISTGVKW
ncbi:MAG: hypothetical protein ACK5P7_05365 [Bdellovibrio sp.]|jgi:hypothetical protein